ncbi:MAG: helicase-related protein [Metamycoplasmataceae bacterium]
MNIDNKSKLLGDKLKEELENNSEVYIISPNFSIYAFDALRKELSNIKKLKFIFSSPIFIQENIKDKLIKERREYFIPNALNENNLYGTEYELKLKNKLTQKAIAKDCADWIKLKADFKSNITGKDVYSFIQLHKENKIITFNQTKDFTSSGLGYEASNDFFTNIIISENNDSDKYLFNVFNSIWNSQNYSMDVTNNMINYISSAYVDNAPNYIYFLSLYNIFKDFLSDITNSDYLPNEATGFKNSAIWSKLYNFQKDGVIGVISRLEKFNGCILADSVGLGKTFTALGVMKYYASRNKNILVLAPKKLADNWNRYRNNVKTNIFMQDKISFDVLYHTDLGRVQGESNGINLKTINWNNYDLVVIDESHNFRNNNSRTNKESRYQFLQNKVLNSNVKSKVLMLSATPVNNKFTDLKNQLALAYGEDKISFDEKLDTSKPADNILRSAQYVFNEWIKLPNKERKTSDLIDRLDIDFAKLLDNVTIARSKKHITKYYNVDDIGNFPKRLEPISKYSELSVDDSALKIEKIYERLVQVNMSVYSPLDYVLQSRISKYQEIYDKKTKIGTTFKQSDRGRALKNLMATNILKRLGSCVESFRLTLAKILEKNKTTFNNIIKFEKGDLLSNNLSYEQVEEENLMNEDFDIDNYESTSGKVKIDFNDMDLRTWKSELEKDIDLLSDLLEHMEKISPYKDQKLKDLVELIKNKIKNPINKNNKKILIFSEYADTVNYLYENLAPLFKNMGINSAKVHGSQQANKATIDCYNDAETILTFFSPKSKERDLIFPDDKDKEIDLLFATDCVSEGQNLQDCDYCINYDIHWNPVKITQRFGRIDRIGSLNKYIQLVNFWPNIDLDEFLEIKEKINSKMLMVNASATTDDNPIKLDDEFGSDYRKEQIKRLQNGELQDLEDIDGSISLTDLGLNEFRMDIQEYIKDNGIPKNITNGLYAIVKHDKLKDIQKGVIFVLKNTNQKNHLGKVNRLHPYYLVYLNESGKVIHTHMEAKEILDKLRSICKPETKPLDDLCNDFNHETNDGYDMQKYSALLDKAIESIIQVKKGNDIDDIFSGNARSLFKNNISGLNDFELISFVIVK